MYEHVDTHTYIMYILTLSHAHILTQTDRHKHSIHSLKFKTANKYNISVFNYTFEMENSYITWSSQIKL